MRAAVIKAPNTDLQIEDHDCPSPSSGEVLIRVHACGVCHGDLMLQHGQFPFTHYPIVPGHEIAGVVEDVGQGVSNLQHGDRVGLSALFSSCGRCQQCLKDDEFLCPKMQFTGITHDGGYQQFMLARADYVARLPDQLSFVEAAPLMCAGLTVFSGLRHAGFQPQNKVAVIGLGGLGHIGVLFVRAMGGRVAVLSTSANKRYEALDLGAELFINIESESASEALRAWDGGADIILATSPAAEPMGAAFPGLALNGTMMVLGAPPNDIAVSPMELIMGRRRLMGSPAGSRKDLRDTLDLAATHSVCARVTPMPLEHAGKALK
jgi:alcohol dehydrogenase